MGAGSQRVMLTAFTLSYSLCYIDLKLCPGNKRGNFNIYLLHTWLYPSGQKVTVQVREACKLLKVQSYLLNRYLILIYNLLKIYLYAVANYLYQMIFIYKIFRTQTV